MYIYIFKYFWFFIAFIPELKKWGSELRTEFDMYNGTSK